MRASVPKGEGTLIFSYIRRLGSFLGVQNFKFQYFGVFQTKEYFWGDTFWGSSQNWAIFRGHFYAFLVLFLRSRYRMGIFLGSLKFLIITWGA